MCWITIRGFNVKTRAQNQTIQPTRTNFPPETKAWCTADQHISHLRWEESRYAGPRMCHWSDCDTKCTRIHEGRASVTLAFNMVCLTQESWHPSDLCHINHTTVVACNSTDSGDVTIKKNGVLIRPWSMSAEQANHQSLGMYSTRYMRNNHDSRVSGLAGAHKPTRFPTQRGHALVGQLEKILHAHT